VTAAEIVPIACSLVSVGCAVFVTIRAGNWRQSDAAQELDDRIGAIETRVQACELRVHDLPSKADLERLRGEIHTGTELTKAALEGVRRIETFWMQSRVAP
jgi:hypothetical protein